MCDCNNVTHGSEECYEQMVLISPPIHMANYLKKRNLNPLICIDPCVVEEINYLWNIGITTTGCCCGHNSQKGYIGVIDDDVSKMKQLGYRVQVNQMRVGAEDTFDIKNGYNMSNSENEEMKARVLKERNLMNYGEDKK